MERGGTERQARNEFFGCVGAVPHGFATAEVMQARAKLRPAPQQKGDTNG